MINKQSFNLVPKYKQVNVSMAFIKRAKKEGSEEYMFLNNFRKKYPTWEFYLRNGDKINFEY